MRALALLGLVACTGEGTPPDGTDPADRAGLQVRLVVEADDDDSELDRLAVHIDEVVLEASGPQGPISVSTSAALQVSLIGAATGADTVVLDLPAGRYDDVLIDVSLREGGGMAALDARGVVDERDILLQVRPGLVLMSERGSVQLGEGPDPSVLLRLRPKEWFDGVDWDDLEGEDEEPIVIGPQAGAAYDEIVDRIVETTETEFPGDG